MQVFVKVGTWSVPRRALFRPEDGRIVIEVKLGGCRNCEACSLRKRQVEGSLRAAGLDKEAVWELEDTLLTLPDRLKESNEEKLSFLSRALGEPVREIDWV